MGKKDEKTTSRATTVRGTLTSRQKSLFVSGTDFYANGTGRVAAPYREMMIGEKMTSGRRAIVQQTITFRDMRRMELPEDYSGTGAMNKGHYSKVTRGNWETTGSSVIVLKPNELYRHLMVVAHQIPIASEHWRMVLAQRALAVFRESFKMKKYNSWGGAKWQKISKWTRDKRKRKGTWPGAGRLMQETNALYKSLEVYNKGFTSGVLAKAPYAGIHNFGEDENGKPYTYGNGFGKIYSPAKQVVQRQFMGHSTKIDDFIMEFEKRYLFDTIFRRPV